MRSQIWLLLLPICLGLSMSQDAVVSEITKHTSPTGKSAFVHHKRKFSQRTQRDSSGGTIQVASTTLLPQEDLTINYGIFGGQFHFEKVDPGDLTSKYGCYGQPDRQPTYYIANANGYQTLSQNQFEQVVHLFPLNCGGSNVVLQQQQRAARLLADNQRMAEAIQTKLGQDGAMSPTMVLLVPFCPNNENDALDFLQQWRQHASPVNVAGYLFSRDKNHQ